MPARWKPNADFPKQMQAAVREGCTAYLLILSRAVRAQLSKPGTGRIYRRSTARARALRKAKTWEDTERVNAKYSKPPRNLREAGFHKASAPNNPPAVDTGTLRRSWQVGRSQVPPGTPFPQEAAAADNAGRRRGKQVAARVILTGNATRIGYQFGSALKYARIEYGYGKAAARPYLRPSINAVRSLFKPTMETALRRHFPKGPKFKVGG